MYTRQVALTAARYAARPQRQRIAAGPANIRSRNHLARARARARANLVADLVFYSRE